jgi:hypothetical protein
MEKSQQASIYKLEKEKKLLIHSISNLIMGASIASEPFIWLKDDSPKDIIIENIMLALKNNKANVPNPNNWDEISKMFLTKTGMNKQSDVYKDTKLVNILMKNKMLYFTPMKNLGSKGFIIVSKEYLEISVDETADTIYDVLLSAFSKCE